MFQTTNQTRSWFILGPLRESHLKLLCLIESYKSYSLQPEPLRVSEHPKHYTISSRSVYKTTLQNLLTRTIKNLWKLPTKTFTQEPRRRYLQPPLQRPSWKTNISGSSHDSRISGPLRLSWSHTDATRYSTVNHYNTYFIWFSKFETPCVCLYPTNFQIYTYVYMYVCSFIHNI